MAAAVVAGGGPAICAARVDHRPPRLLAVDRKNGRVTRTGSKIPLARNITVFLLQYAIAVTAAVDPHGHAAVALIGRAISGACAGYFIGWVIALLRHYRNSPEHGL